MFVRSVGLRYGGSLHTFAATSRSTGSRIVGPLHLLAPRSSTEIGQCTTFFSNDTKKSATTPSTADGIRLSKLLAKHATNLTLSRRQAEGLIRDGQVTLLGEVVTEPYRPVSYTHLTLPTKA